MKHNFHERKENRIYNARKNIGNNKRKAESFENNRAISSNDSDGLEKLRDKLDHRRFVVLSFGGGQDSTTILYLLLFDVVFRERYLGDAILILIMSDTGDEHPATYEHVKFVTRLCQDVAVPFYFLTPDQKYHKDSWPSLIAWMRRTKCIMSKAFRKTCTDNLKIVPIYNFIDHYIGETYYGGALSRKMSRKRFIKKYADQYGPLTVIIGIAAREEHRLGGTLPNGWMQQCIKRIYPLVELGYDRQRCQEIIAGYGLPLPPPSNCMRCPFLNEIELVWLYRFFPHAYYEWVELEQAKIDKWAATRDTKNLGVFGDSLLPEVLQKALRKYGHWTSERLQEYKMSHGHCVQSRY